MTHEKEINRWSRCSDGTRVWFKGKGEWSLTIAPSWRPSVIYIVDDEWAKLRKAREDGIQLQHRQGNTGYHDVDLTDWECTNPEDWRIKPKKPEYEWQWLHQYLNGTWDITNEFYTKEPLGRGYLRLVKYEPSKRERR